MNLSEWMKSEPSSENDAICIFLSTLKTKLERRYPNTEVEVAITECGSLPYKHFYLSFNLRCDRDGESLYASYIAHYLSSPTASELIAKASTTEIMDKFISNMRCFQ